MQANDAEHNEEITTSGGRVKKFLASFWNDITELPLPLKILVAFIAVAGVGASLSVMWLGVNSKQSNQPAQIRDLARKARSDQLQGRPSEYRDNNLPVSNRNQGLEEVLAKFDAISQRLDRIERDGIPTNSQRQPANDSSGNVQIKPDQLADLSEPVSPTYQIPARKDQQTKQVGASPTPARESGTASAEPITPSGTIETVKQQPSKVPVSSPPQIYPNAGKKQVKTMTVARYSAVESVILVGFFARSAATPGAAGSMGSSLGFGSAQTSSSASSSRTNSALGVGARFVALIKGELMMPNGFRSGVLDSCFIGGSAIGSLSDSRAKAIAEAISCISPDGQITDIPVQGYVQDADGTNGIAGNLVNKQGPIVMRSALAGLASGIGQAISPYQVPGFNSTAGGVTFPSAETIARSAAGQGISNASSQLAQFYLSYARETLPGVEVTAGSRVTWVFTEPFDIELSQGTRK